MFSRIAVTKTTLRGRNPAVVLVGALASLALHALLLAPMLYGAGHKPHTPDALGSAPADRPGADGALIVELIEESDSAPKASAHVPKIAPLQMPSDASLRAATADLVRSLPPPDLPGERESQAPAAQVQGDEAAAARLYGMYVGQISARIERAWLKPRSSPGADRFVCRVQVLQNASGDVLKVTLSSCNGDARWQSSLVRAIETASPLPAPPDARVFKKHIALQFDADAFVAGGSSEGFEPEARLALANVRAVSAPSGDAASPAPNNVIEQLRSLKNGKAGTVDLRIGAN
jgi:hypothetical protein